jgi:hypothetical protein
MNKTLNYFENTMGSVKTNLDNNTMWMQDQTIVNIIVLAIVIYSALFVGKIWPKGMNLFKNPLIKIITFLAIAYISTRNITLAFVATIAIIAVMMTNLKNTQEFMDNEIAEDEYSANSQMYNSMMGGCICQCDGVRCSCKCSGNGESNMEQIEDHDDNEVVYNEKPEGVVGMIDEKQKIAEINDQALDNVRRQMLSHEMEKDKNKLENGDIGSGCNNCGKCGDSPYRRSTTPFGRHKVLEDVFSNVNIDSEYAPLNFS